MTTFKLMTWNLENLYRAGHEYGPKQADEYAAKLEGLAGVILQLAPDVLAVQEVGEPEALDDLIARLNGGYPFSQLSAYPDGRGIRVGFISRLPIQAAVDWNAFPPGSLDCVPGIDSAGNLIGVTAMGRGALCIRVSPTAGLPVYLLTAHLKSKLLSYPTPSGKPRFTPKDENEHARVAGFATMRRMAESIALRVIATGMLAGNTQTALIVCGDMNDVPESATVSLLHGPDGSGIGTPGFDHPDQGDDTRLFNLAPLIAPERRYSRINNGVKELIDQILVSQELLPGTPRRLPVVDSQLEMVNPLPSVGDDPNRRRGKPCSDHAPLTALFEF